MVKGLSILVLISVSSGAFAQDEGWGDRTVEETSLTTQEGVKSAIPQGYEQSDSVFVCTIPLPVSSSASVNRIMFGMKHVYLKVEAKTYGMPYTAKETYFGGDAYFYNGDPFYKKIGSKGEQCFPVLKETEKTQKSFLKRSSCIAEKLSDSQTYNKQPKKWKAIFDYHALKNNCGSMVDFAVQCAGGLVDKKFNFSVGGKVPDSKPAKILDLITRYAQPSTYGEICALAKAECDEEARGDYND